MTHNLNIITFLFMTKSIFIFMLFLITNPGVSQNSPYEVKFSYQIEEDVANGKIGATKAGSLYSLIGEYHIANSYSDIPISWGVDSMDLELYSTTAAIPKILEQAENHRVIIISENHLKPQHRIFAKQLLRELSKIGFKHLGLETFANVDNSNKLLDSKLTERGYPLNSPLTGTYTLEPRMGELVRDAIQLNYKLFAYERSDKIAGKDRDEIQAENIIRYLSQHENEKVVILCGFHHAIESDLLKYNKFQWMASQIKSRLEIDPLTIYQDNFTEKIKENGHPYLNTFLKEEPSIFTNEKGDIVQLSRHVDIEIIHPRTHYRNNRPSWLFEDKQYQPVTVAVDTDSLSYPVIASAFYFHEKENPVPVDIIEIKHKYDNKCLVLKKGKYRIKLTDGKSKIEFEQIVE